MPSRPDSRSISRIKFCELFSGAILPPPFRNHKVLHPRIHNARWNFHGSQLQCRVSIQRQDQARMVPDSEGVVAAHVVQVARVGHQKGIEPLRLHLLAYPS